MASPQHVCHFARQRGQARYDAGMKFVVVSAGKPALAYAKSGIEFYLGRLKPYGGVGMVTVRDGGPEEVSARLLAASEGCLRIALDERGSLWTTMELTNMARQWELHTVKKVAFLIGASDGHTDALRDQCGHLMALAKFTMQHELALVVLLEQLYRVRTVMAGSPYHRA